MCQCTHIFHHVAAFAFSFAELPVQPKLERQQETKNGRLTSLLN